ncbi:MAG: hypothetical protein C4343_02385 [Chloroflexota bacterium]
MAELPLQVDLTTRLLVAAALGAAIGLEREIHEHPAGMRTHLLVSVGSAIFTVLSIYGFIGVLPSGQAGPVDPSRIAAQIVSGIGFLGAGAIIKYGTSIRGLTTAASLWATAAVGMASGAGDYVVAGVGSAIVVFSLWPLNLVVDRLRISTGRGVRLRLTLSRLEQIGVVWNELNLRRIEIAGIGSQRLGKSRYEVELDLRLPPGVRPTDVVDAITSIPDVELIESVPIRE